MYSLTADIPVVVPVKAKKNVVKVIFIVTSFVVRLILVFRKMIKSVIEGLKPAKSSFYRPLKKWSTNFAISIRFSICFLEK